MRRSSRVQGIWLRNWNVWITCDWICLNSSSSGCRGGSRGSAASSGVMTGLRLAQMIDEGAQRQAADASSQSSGRTAGSLASATTFEMLVDLAEQAGELGVPAAEHGSATSPRRPAARWSSLRRATLSSRPRLMISPRCRISSRCQRVELLGLHEDLLAHPDLAEVVQQRGVANLAHLVGGEPHVAKGPVGGAVHRLAIATVRSATRRNAPRWWGRATRWR